MDTFDLRLWPGFKLAGGDLSSPALIDQVTIDSRQIDSNSSLFAALPGLQTDGHSFIEHAAKWGAKYALVHSKYIPKQKPSALKLLYVDNPLHALQEIAKAYRNELPTKIIAITGSYGKTMVKDLLHELLKRSYQVKASPESFNSQIGVPLSIFTLSKNHEFGLIEAAISEKNEMTRIREMLAPDFGIITQIGEKHIDRLGDVPALVSELVKLYESGTAKWVMIPSLPETRLFLDKLPQETYFWNEDELSLPHASRLSEKYELSIPYIIRFPDAEEHRGQITSGYSYYLDLLNMAVKAAFQLGVPSKTIREGLNQYTLEPIRKEIWKSPRGISFINDSYAEDPLSIDHALKFLKNNSGTGRKFFVFEGLKGNRSDEDYKRVGAIISGHPLDLLLLVGEKNFAPLIDILAENNTISILRAPSYEDAFKILELSLHPGDTVLIKGSKKEPIETIIKCFHESLCTNLCQVNLAAIEHNIKILRKKLPTHTRMMVMVKALAYGTDPLCIAKFLKSCAIDILGLSYVEEGIALRQGGITQSLFVLNTAIYETEHVVKWDLEIGVSGIETIEKLAKEARERHKVTKVHLHVDTGMKRFGCRPDEALKLAKLIKSFPSLHLEGIFTHFVASDDPTQDLFTIAQAEMLQNVITELKNEGIDPLWKHAANSAGVLRFSFKEFNMARVSLAIYGLQPMLNHEKNHLRLAISLISRIAGINHCKKGDTISYGRSYTVEKDEMVIAVLPIGYFDGLHRNYSGRGNVLIRGIKAPMLGKICMDFMMVDVTNIPNVQSGDPVLIFGEDERGNYLSPELLAIQGNSISHELITCLGPRIQRFFIYEETHQKERHD